MTGARTEHEKSFPDSLLDFYPAARKMRRELILVAGPTNSGKTHDALERLKKAETGTYLGPLRLLALEVRDRLSATGLPVSLETGELVERVPGARHIAATIEMVRLDTPVDVAVIDEVQMLSDPQRGFAWLQAIIGVPAREVWLLGSQESVGAVRMLAEILGEPLRIVKKRRLAPLTVAEQPVSIENIPDESAIIAFSRLEVLSLAGELREKHGRRPAVIYGALSPEVRREQARMFREGEADVVVATDAIGMGLNLPIRSIIFTAHQKWNGKSMEPVPRVMVWQIAGRAGRYGMHEHGTVGATDETVLESVRKSLSAAPPQVPRMFTFSPTWRIVDVLSRRLRTEKITSILRYFCDKLTMPGDDFFKPGIDDDRMVVATLLDRMNLTLREKLTLLNAPTPMFRGEPDPMFSQFIRRIEAGRAARVGEFAGMTSRRQGLSQEDAERAVKLLSLYCWLHYRFREIFPDLDDALWEMSEMNRIVSEHLSTTAIRKCSGCGDDLPWDHRFRICEDCFRGRNNGW